MQTLPICRLTRAAWLTGAAERGQNAVGGLHAANVFRAGFAADQDDAAFGRAFAVLDDPGLGILGVELMRPVAAPGPALMPLASSLPSPTALRLASGSKIGCSSWFRSSGGMRLGRKGFFLGDQAFVHHIDREAHGGEAGALAVARLQHPELALLDGELDVLHVVVVLLEHLADLVELLVDLGHVLAESRRSSWACGCRPPRLRPGR